MDKFKRRDILGFTVVAASATLLPTAAQSNARTATPWQTEGPFFPMHEQSDKDADLTVIDGQSESALGEVVEVKGRILDTEGNAITGALIDIWQANAAGRYTHERDSNTAPLDPHFQGWARLVTGADGSYSVRTIKPGAYSVKEGWDRQPHIHYKVAKRGYKEITTQLYFKGDPLNNVDQLLLAVPEDERADLIGDFSKGAATFDVVLARV